jgi:hypothetical protein
VIPGFVGERDVTDHTQLRVVAFPSAPGHQPVTPAAEPGSAVPPGMGVVADQEAFHANECPSFRNVEGPHREGGFKGSSQHAVS